MGETECLFKRFTRRAPEDDLSALLLLMLALANSMETTSMEPPSTAECNKVSPSCDARMTYEV